MSKKLSKQEEINIKTDEKGIKFYSTEDFEGMRRAGK